MMKKANNPAAEAPCTQPEVLRRPKEYSFTLLEVIIAVGLLVAVVMQVAGGQGSLLEITDYSKKATEATWLAKRLMSEVEYNYAQYDLKDMELTTSIKDEPFKDLNDPEADFKYSIAIEEWKLPLIDFLTGGGGKSEEEKERDKDEGKPESSTSGIPGLDGIINTIFDGNMMKTAHVEVSWPEGARRNSVAMTYLLTNQKKLDEYILTKTNTWDAVRKKMDPSATGTGGAGGGSAGGGAGAAGGANPGGTNPGGRGPGAAGTGGAGTLPQGSQPPVTNVPQ